MAPDSTRPVPGFLLALAAAAVTFLVTELCFAWWIGAPWAEPEQALGAALAVGLPLALPLAALGAGMAVALRRRGWWALLPAAVAPLFVVGAVAFNVEWLRDAGKHVEDAASQAFDENGFFLCAAVWNGVDGLAALFMLPVLMILFFVDLALLPLVVLFSPVFLVAVGLFLVKTGLMAGLGMAVAAGVCWPVLRWVERR